MTKGEKELFVGIYACSLRIKPFFNQYMGPIWCLSSFENWTNTQKIFGRLSWWFKLNFMQVIRWAKCSETCPLMKYHTNEEYRNELSYLENQNPQHAITFSLGESHRKRTPLKGIRLSKNIIQTVARPSIKNDIYNGNFKQVLPGIRPMVKLIGNIHGNEPVGRELLMHFMIHFWTPLKAYRKHRKIYTSHQKKILNKSNT